MRRLCALSIALLSALPASAQNIDKAITAFKRGEYEVAAAQFYAVLRFEADEQGDLAEAQYGLAKSFENLGLPIAALKYYGDIVKVGSDHPHFDKAVQGLVEVGDRLDDDITTPQLLDSIYTNKNAPALQKMNPEVLQRVHFVLGRHAFMRSKWRDAKDFLGTVKTGNPNYPHAQYMLGLMRLGIARGDKDYVPKYNDAVDAFEKARAAVPVTTRDQSLLDLRDLASLGLARTFYEQAYQLEDGDPKRAEGLSRAMREFQAVPRFSANWSKALFERAWAHTVTGEYGRALGALHSLEAPYFRDEFYPEAKTLQAIVYYYNCQWDRVNSIIEKTKAEYEPMAQALSELVASNLALDEWYPLLKTSLADENTAEGDSLLPRAVAGALANDPKFAKMEKFVQELEREARTFETTTAFAKSDIGREMVDFANDTRKSYVSLVGKYLKTRVGDLASELGDITTRASLIALETKTAEADWLEQGKDIDQSKLRKRQPRPFIPDDSFQFWWFRNEYWVDELGYYEFTIKTECFEE